MQSALILCVLALSSSAVHVAFNFKEESVQEPPGVTKDLLADTTQLLHQPEPGTQQVTATQVVADAAVSAVQTISQPQPATTQVVASTAQSQATPAMVPIAVAQPSSQLPASSAFAPPTALVTSQPQGRNVTKMAFGQITDLGTEFHQLREDDQAHVAQLGVDIHLREHLEQELHEAEKRLEHDNGELAQETSGIVGAAPSAGVMVPQNDTQDMTQALVQAGSISIKADIDQVAVDTARDVKMLNADINSLHTRDAKEVQALRGNMETRSALGAQIAKEREELMADSGGLATNLGQIRDLVAPSNAGAAAVSSNMATPSPEALVQQDTPVEAAQETMPAAVSSAGMPASSSAPEAADGSTWLR